jgi:hypothetical protein
VNSRLVTKFLAANEKDKLDIRQVVGKSSFKISGRDAKAIAKRGGGITMFHHLDAILTELRIKNCEALNFHFESLLTLELKSSEAEALMQRLYRKMSSLQDICPDTFKHEDTVGSEIDELQEILVQ